MEKILFFRVLVAFCAVFRASTTAILTPITTAAPVNANPTTSALRIMNATILEPANTNVVTPEPTITNATTLVLAKTNAPAIDTPYNYEISYRGKRSLLQTTEYNEEVSYSDPQCIETAYEENGVTNFIRGCYYAPEDTEASTDSTDQCREVIGSTGTIIKCNICTKDLCNASGKAKATIALIAAGVISTLF